MRYSSMASYDVNSAAVDKCRSLIDAGQYQLDTEWSDVKPDADAENAFVERNGWTAYGQWHLGVREGAGQETKERYGFPYGDFHRVQRSGLIAIIDRAGEWDHDAVQAAARDLLDHLDEVTGRADD